MISVVMPVYNGERFLAEAVESVLNQTYKDFEFIIVDDGSTDSTPQMLQRYAEKDPRVKIINAGKVGLSKAMNLGMTAAQYPWIARMDADDVCLPRRLEACIEAAQADPDVVVWGTGIHHINAKGKVLSTSRVGPRTREQFNHLRQTGQAVQVINPSAMMRKDIVDKVGGYKEAFTAAHDLEIFDEMAEYGPILCIPEILVLYRVHGTSISAKKFFTQKKLARYVEARRHARLESRPIPTLEDFLANYDNLPWRKRFKRNRQDLQAYYYRAAGLAYAERQYPKMAWSLIVATVLRPQYVVKRLWNQVFSHGVEQTPAAAPQNPQREQV
jgi:glycosyltransferase involved in cell wall biosynthesis